jgi:Ca2+-binding RTX toxin-like protein
VADEFAIVTTDAEAATSTADIVYNSVNGNLFYNSNGTAPGFGTGALFATLTGAPPLLATDFIIVDGDDSLMGGQANDTLDGGAGNDSLVGDLGNDTLDGGAGNDSLDGGFGGDDSLDGGYGNDTLIGWNGDDSLMGGDGNDYLYGDFFYGGDGGDDSLDGGEGNDSLNGGNGNDSLDGGEGNDSLMGGEGNDSLMGGEGNDSLDGGNGNDTLMGGEGSDRFVYTSSTTFNPVIFGVDVISDFVSGSDQIHLQRAIFPSLSSVGGTGFSVADEFAIVTTDAEAATSTADIVYNSVNGNLFYNSNGTAPGFGTGALFATLTGAPPLLATDFIIVDGDDSLIGGQANDTIDGEVGNDFLYGGAGNDFLYGEVGNDSLYGGTGDDSLYGGTGDDSLDGGGGYFFGENGGDDYLNGGDGDDSLYGGEGNDSLYGGDGDDSLNGEAGNDSLNGGAGNDSLYGGEGNDSLDAGAGNDSLNGGAGNDSLNGGDGSDTLDGGFYDGAGNDSLNGGAGNDSLNGGDGNDSLNGGDGSDTLDGGTGNDSLIGGEGSDRFVYSTSGTVFNPLSFGVDVITDFETGTDKIVLNKTTFNSISSPVGTGLSLLGEFALVTSDVDAAASTADIVYNSVNGNLFYNPNGSNPGFGTGTLLLTLTGAPPLLATDFMIEASPLQLYGGLGNDSLDGGDGNDSLVGGADNDTLIGGKGNDLLLGASNSLYAGYDGNDFLDGGDGDDTLDGQVGNDSLIGGEGSDRFVYSTSGTALNPFNLGVDVITDFETGTDKIVLNKTTFNSISSPVGTGLSVCGEFATVTSDVDAATSTADIVYNSVNGNLFYNPNGSNPGFGTGALLLTLTGTPALIATDFMIEASPLQLYSGLGNDSLVGGEGNDSLVDGAGNDTLIGGNGNDALSGGVGNDSLVGGAGNDSLVGGEGNDSLDGGAGNDTLVGGLGNDSLVGGLGSDRFVYSSEEYAPGNLVFGVDVIADFETGNDKIVLDVHNFGSLGSAVGTGLSMASEFAIVTSDADAASSIAEIVYNSVNGNLFYNPNGSHPGFGTGALFATLVDAPTFVATDIEIIHSYPIID